MKKLRLGTRKSALAQAQAQWVSEQLRTVVPDLDVELILMTTSGDLQAQRFESEPGSGPSLHRIPPGGLKAMFTKEIEEALIEEQIDAAVHSLKDMAADLPTGLCLTAVPEREDPRDAWITKNGLPFANVRFRGKIATGAVRRQAQLRHHRPDLELFSMRGNIDTRLRKLAEGDYDGLILALAGLKRLGWQKAVTEILPEEIMVPAVGQGALGLEIRKNDDRVQDLMQNLDHPASHQAALAERAFLRTLGGNCQTPIAAHAQVRGTQLTMTGVVVSPPGDPYLRENEEGPASQAEAIGQRLAQKLIALGADAILS